MGIWHRANRNVRLLVWSSRLFGAASNVLLLAGPGFMLAVYRLALPAHDTTTLLWLAALAAGLIAACGVLDHARRRLLACVGLRYHSLLSRAALRAAHAPPARASASVGGHAIDAVDTLTRFLQGPAATILQDLAWAPVFLIGLFAFDHRLGWLGLASAFLLLLMAIAGGAAMPAERFRLMKAQQKIAELEGAVRREGPVLRAIGVQAGLCARLQDWRAEALARIDSVARRMARLAALVRTLRLGLQSAMLAAGGWLVIHGSLDPGAMVVSSVLLGRALAPVELLAVQWPALVELARARRLLSRALDRVPCETEAAPARVGGCPVRVDGLCVDAEDGRRLVENISFSVGPGQIVVLSGPSGAGKSTLLRALAGERPVSAGKVRLPGGRRGIGYCPQTIRFVEGTVAENITRFENGASVRDAVAAARRAGAHDMILELGHGYQTWVGPGGEGVSSGEARRIALARALYAAPAVLLIDDPGLGLDDDALAATAEALKAESRRGAAIVVATRQAELLALADRVIELRGGRIAATFCQAAQWRLAAAHEAPDMSRQKPAASVAAE